jgi:hypothetical protein
MSINSSDRVRRRRSKSLRVGEMTPADRGAMVAIALRVAASEPRQKDLMVRLIQNLLGSGETAISH